MYTKNLFRYFFGTGPGAIAQKVILSPIFDPGRFCEGSEKREAFKGLLYSGSTVQAEGGRFSVIDCGIGSALAGDAVIALGTVAKVEEILFTGTCGGLYSGAAAGDLVVPGSAFDGEGFSKYYDKDFDIEKMLRNGTTVKSDPVLTERLSGYLKKRTDIHEGALFTIGSLSAEKREHLEALQKNGFKGVDMELSAVYRAGEVSGIKTAAVLAVSDVPLLNRLGEKLALPEKKAYEKALKDIVKYSVGFIREEI